MKKKSILIVVIVICIIAGLGYYSYYTNKMKEILVYKDVLDETAVTVDSKELLVRDMAFYVAYEERTVEDQAEIYNDEDTNAYWNLHINGEFMKVTARKAAMNMAVHDEIFYEMAQAEGISLSEEETATLEQKQSDFWMDLSDEAKERLTVSQDEINEVMGRMALAQKYQNIYAGMQGAGYEDYDFEGDAYLKLKEQHQVVINEKVWDRLDFGNITLNH